MGVWIETSVNETSPSIILSHPAWVCGLKLGKNLFLTNDKRSHPAWVCGLKQGVNMECDGEPGSHPAWVCGLKLDLL